MKEVPAVKEKEKKNCNHGKSQDHLDAFHSAYGKMFYGEMELFSTNRQCNRNFFRREVKCGNHHIVIDTLLKKKKHVAG